MKIQVPFQQLLTLVKSLTPTQKARLRQELAKGRPQRIEKNEYIEYLLNGPVYSEEEIQVIEENRKSIAAWRTES